MPVKILGKTYVDHKSAVKALEKKKPGIKKPDAYVATVERAEKHGQQLKARLQKLAVIDYSHIEGFGGACPDCKGRNKKWATKDCPTCEGTGKQMYPKYGKSKKIKNANPTITGSKTAAEEKCQICGENKEKHSYGTHKFEPYKKSQLKARLQKLGEEYASNKAYCPTCAMINDEQVEIHKKSNPTHKTK